MSERESEGAGGDREESGDRGYKKILYYRLEVLIQ